MGLSFGRILLISVVLLLSEFAGGLELNWLFHTHTLKDLALGWSKCLNLAWQIAKFFIDFPAIFDVKRVSYWWWNLNSDHGLVSDDIALWGLADSVYSCLLFYFLFVWGQTKL